MTSGLLYNTFKQLLIAELGNIILEKLITQVPEDLFITGKNLLL